MNSQQLWSKLCRQVIVMTILSGSALTYASDYPLEDVVSGPAGFEYDHERDRSLHAPESEI